MKKTLLMILLIHISAHAMADKHLTADELKAVLVGSTEYGVYTNKGQQLNYWEFYRPDGVIRATEDKYAVYSGKYTINADGCLNADYDGDEYDGCYYYSHLQDDQYTLTSPQGNTSTVTIKKGDVKKINGF